MTPDIEALCARLEGFAKNYSQSTHRCNRVDCQNPACIAYDCIKAAAALRELQAQVKSLETDCDLLQRECDGHIAALREQAGELLEYKGASDAGIEHRHRRAAERERDALQARVRELSAEFENAKGHWTDDMCRLRAENEKLRKDAERYRWLKEDCAFADLASMFDRNNDDIDPYIDAAMAAGEKP